MTVRFWSRRHTPFPGPTSFGPGYDRTALRVLRRAQNLATVTKRFGPGEIVVALSEIRSGASGILARHGASSGLRAVLIAMPPGQNFKFAVPDELGQQVLDTARDWTSGRRLACPTHLLLAALQQRSDICMDLLTRSGLSHDELRRKAISATDISAETSLILSPLRSQLLLPDAVQQELRLRVERIPVAVNIKKNNLPGIVDSEYWAAIAFAESHQLDEARKRLLVTWHMNSVQAKLATAYPELARRSGTSIPLEGDQWQEWTTAGRILGRLRRR